LQLPERTKGLVHLKSRTLTLMPHFFFAARGGGLPKEELQVLIQAA
jgi:hypothetical protein